MDVKSGFTYVEKIKGNVKLGRIHKETSVTKKNILLMNAMNSVIPCAKKTTG